MVSHIAHSWANLVIIFEEFPRVAYIFVMFSLKIIEVDIASSKKITAKQIIFFIDSLMNLVKG